MKNIDRNDEVVLLSAPMLLRRIDMSGPINAEFGGISGDNIAEQRAILAQDRIYPKISLFDLVRK